MTIGLSCGFLEIMHQATEMNMVRCLVQMKLKQLTGMFVDIWM